MDKLDYLILAELHKDAAMSFVDIARAVNSTPNKVRRRYERMKQTGIIFSCIATLNLARLGYQGKAFLLITLKPNSSKLVAIDFINKVRNVVGVSEIIGQCDLIALAPITDLDSIQALLAEIKKGPNIQKVEFYCIDDTYFPIGHNFDKLLNERCRSIAEKL